MNLRQMSLSAAFLCVCLNVSNAQPTTLAFQSFASASARRTPTLMNSDVWAVGVGVRAGGIGVERVQWTRRALGAGVGVGVAGPAAQVLAYPLEALGRFDAWKTYVAAEGLIAPWQLGQFRARAVTGFTIGLQRNSIVFRCGSAVPSARMHRPIICASNTSRQTARVVDGATHRLVLDASCARMEHSHRIRLGTFALGMLTRRRTAVSNECCCSQGR